MKKKVLMLLAAGLCAAFLSGCASGDDTENIRLMVWSPSEDQSKDSGEWLQTNCEAFAKEHTESRTRLRRQTRWPRTRRPAPMCLCLPMTL